MQVSKERRKPGEMVAPVELERIAILLLECMDFVPASRVADLVQDWMGRMDVSDLPADREAALLTEAMTLATTLAVFTPSGGSTVAAERLARARPRKDPADAAALATLRQAQFRLVVVEVLGVDTSRLRDLCSGETLLTRDVSLMAGYAGLHLVAWFVPLPGGLVGAAGAVTPLDEAALAVAAGFVRSGRPSLLNPSRCADAVYRHVVRNGTVRIAGMNHRELGNEEEDEIEGSELDWLAAEWAQPGAQRGPEAVQFVRSMTSLHNLIDVFGSVSNTRDHGLTALSEAYAAIALLQLETVQRRAAVGSGSLTIPAVQEALDAAVASGEVPAGARSVFDALRQRLGTASSAGTRARGPDAELEKLIGRIQALRAKTVGQGCTEQEALAAAEKVAELLDRYGLSLSELDLKQQACEGLVIETTRKRVGPLDDCVPASAAFFDCRVWGEKGAGGTLRYVFFGLRADVAAARYMYDLIDQAFASETASFRTGDIYAGTPSGMRRTALNSFQLGLGRGIIAKLNTLRQERETHLRTSGRDLVVAKADIVEAEMSALGMNFRARAQSGRRRVLSEAFDQGHTAGLGFTYTPGVGQGG